MRRGGGRRGVLVAGLLALLFGVIRGLEISAAVEDEQRNGAPEFVSHLELETKAAQAEFDYFVFSQQWPGTYCQSSGTCCQNVVEPATFTVHGLWPENNDGSYPSCCSGPAFDQSKIDELGDLLQQYWPTMSCSSPYQCSGKQTGTFWQHEWEKHGTCSYPTIPDEATYFTVGLNLRLKYDISKILNDAGFVPDSTQTYPTSSVVAALKAAIGASPIFTCTSKQINEIWICVSKDLKIQNCGSSSNSCPTAILIPPFQS